MMSKSRSDGIFLACDSLFSCFTTVDFSFLLS